jgi:hypothetical protein
MRVREADRQRQKSGGIDAACPVFLQARIFDFYKHLVFLVFT